MPGPNDTARRQAFYLVILLSVSASTMGSVSVMLHSSVFGRFLGPLHPALAVGIAAFLALPALAFLIRRHSYRTLGPGAARRGVASAAAFAAIFAVGAIAADLVLRYPETINVPLPQAFLVYPVMALIVELLFHVALLGLVLLLLRPLAAKAGERRVMWTAIALVALAEPILQVVLAGTLSWTELYTAISVFLFGIVQLTLFRRYGVLSMLAMRLFYYLLWHIAWGHLRLDLLF